VSKEVLVKFSTSFAFLEVYRMTEPEEKRHSHNVQNPPVSRKPLELIHG
jgi:hypothetical protein